MPLQSTSGAASYDAFGGGAAAKVNYIEDCFVSWLSTGNGTSRTVTGPDMTTGGLSITKSRSAATGWHFVDTARGAGNSLSSNTTAANASESTGVTAFTATGTSIGAAGEYNTNGATYVDYLLKKQPKFFDVVTTTSQTVSHSLASVAGFVIWKRTDASEDWNVLARKSDGSYVQLNLNLTDGAFASYANASAAGITSTNITLPSFTTGGTYVVYLYAHNAGGFGLTGTDNVISCGSYTGNGAAGGQLINLGYEAQWVMIKNASSAADWWMLDTMRGWVVNGDFGSDQALFANASSAESGQVAGQPDAQGFRPIQDNVNASGNTYIYIAIRRGPMKVPTSGTSVFSPLLTSTTSGATNTTGFPVDSQFLAARGGSVYNSIVSDRLRGVSSNSTETGRFLVTSATSAENTSELVTEGWNNTAFLTPSVFAGVSYITWNFGRAPSFFDEVCYTGNGTAGRTVNHNLGVAPELMIVKRRNSSSDASWIVYAASQGISAGGQLNSNAAFGSMLGYYQWNNTAPTASVFTLGDGATDVNNAAGTYVWYGFATCPGVSKVGSYTGTGTTLQIDCGFTGGARFVLIKRTDSTGDWYVWDSARGIVSGNDPYLLLNSTAAETTGTDYIDTYSAGFEISSTAPAAINASGGTFIFLAIA